MMNDQKKSTGNFQVIQLSGELTVGRITELKESLKNLVDRFSTVHIRFEDVTGIDLSFLQLICSAHRTAASMNKKLVFSGMQPEIVNRILQSAGLTRQRACSLVPAAQCFWQEYV
jgi:anti-anti-sigma factor